ncbi:hypothetical protein HJG54_07550 [Leptolyngbya sp. NK1-12]|uniref:Uncharacterized protein n=1 Tax=Leptolyngbya sp. NK1-12 TaxID=2547451 RepID=A0AA97AF28_9CYAN|nr:hypothetical protein [Leptolyngbya sp. NK1-12]WNZ22725.1 hypothetical protein HJG54_07550 [Leptolyngbya sp. NK1-12]
MKTQIYILETDFSVPGGAVAGAAIQLCFRQSSTASAVETWLLNRWNIETKFRLHGGWYSATFLTDQPDLIWAMAKRKAELGC